MRPDDDSRAPVSAAALPPAARPVSPRFGGAALALGCLFVILMGSLIRHEWNVYANANDAVAAFHVFRDTLVAMEKVSAERAPTNAALGDARTMVDEPPAPLAAARADTDAALARIGEQLDANACPWCMPEQLTLQHLEASLAAARGNVDGVLRQPLDVRSDDAISNAVTQMVFVARQFAPLIDASQIAAADRTNGSLGALQMARFAAMLRDEAGQLGSRFTGALVRSRPLTPAEQLNVERSYGRVEQLRLAIESLAATEPVLTRGKFARVRERYFTQGIAYVTAVRALMGGPASPLPTTAQFAAKYVPTMQPIVAFRDEMLDRADTTLLRQRRAALVRFIGISMAGLVFASLSFALVLLFRRSVIAPFTDATRAIIAIARGDLSPTAPSHPYRRDEVRALFDAVDVLRTRSGERLRLEQERNALIDQLTKMAETDSLTGLLNRRGFQNRARVLKTVSHDDAWFVTLVEFDLDHFKRINDTFGHPTGDEALRVIGNLCRDTWRREDIVARTGGEEFAVLLATKDPAEALQTVERFRAKLRQTTLHAADGIVFTMTASFGVVVAKHASMPAIETMLAKADSLLYRAKTEGRDRVVADTPETA